MEGIDRRPFIRTTCQTATAFIDCAFSDRLRLGLTHPSCAVAAAGAVDAFAVRTAAASVAASQFAGFAAWDSS